MKGASVIRGLRAIWAVGKFDFPDAIVFSRLPGGVQNLTPNSAASSEGGLFCVDPGVKYSPYRP